MNIKFKRIISAVLACSMILAVTGCDKSDKKPKDDSSAITIKRENITTAPVVETLGDLDLSDVQKNFDVPADYSYVREIESGELSGQAMVLDQKFLGDYSGDGFVAMFYAEDGVTFEANIEADGSYDISIVCAADRSGVVNQITMDGEPLVSFTIDSTDFSENVAEKVLIPAGKHVMGIKSNGELAGTYLDKITITPAEPVDLAQYEVENKLSNPNATEETQRLFNFLTDVYGKYTLSGQYSSNNLGKECREFKEIERNTGEIPAILGLDLIECTPSRVANGAGGGQMVALQAMDWWNNEGGIVTMCWHWNAPEPYLNKDGAPWWEGFNTDATTFNLAAALDGSDPEGYDYLIRDIDTIAIELAKLDDNHVPILWRPLHEGGGDPQWKNPWFWWGASGAEAYKELWILMYDRLTNYHKINNLIWVWNGQEPSYYPGDEYVDIMGYDIYADNLDTSSQKQKFSFTQGVTDTKKIIALSENGVLFDPDAAYNDGARWAWFAVWNGNFALKDMQLSGEFTPLEMWNKVYTHERVLTLDELPDLKNYPLDTEKFLAENK